MKIDKKKRDEIVDKIVNLIIDDAISKMTPDNFLKDKDKNKDKDKDN